MNRPSNPRIAGQDTVLETLTFDGIELDVYRVVDADRILDNIDLEAWKKDERMPYWAEPWPSGTWLARHLAGEGSLDGVRVLELGCGLGLPSLVAARLGADVTTTDYTHVALDLFRVNATMNDVTVNAEYVDWREPHDLDSYDLVLAADVMYERWQSGVVLNLLGTTVAPDGRALIADPDRVTATEFAGAAEYHGFRVKKHSGTVEGFGGKITLYDLEWR